MRANSVGATRRRGAAGPAHAWYALAFGAPGEQNLSVSAASTEPRRDGIAAAAWRELLAFLGRDGRDGGAAYEELRQRLQFFFEWKGCDGAPELADETLNRVAAKLAAGEQIHTDEPRRYAFGVARFVYLEAVKRRARHTQAERADRAVTSEDSPADDAARREARLAALEACLNALPPQLQQILLRYHEDDGRQRIDQRKQLADEMGIALNALRIRVHRLRAQVEDCVRSRLGRTDRIAAPVRTGSP